MGGGGEVRITQPLTEFTKLSIQDVGNVEKNVLKGGSEFH